jgi:hypothetical protein
MATDSNAAAFLGRRFVPRKAAAFCFWREGDERPP